MSKREREVRRYVEKVKDRWERDGKEGQATDNLIRNQVKKYSQQEPHKIDQLREYVRNL